MQIPEDWGRRRRENAKPAMLAVVPEKNAPALGVLQENTKRTREKLNVLTVPRVFTAMKKQGRKPALNATLGNTKMQINSPVAKTIAVLDRTLLPTNLSALNATMGNTKI